MPEHPQSLKFIKKFCQLFEQQLCWGGEGRGEVMLLHIFLGGIWTPHTISAPWGHSMELQQQATKCFGFAAFAIWQSSFGF